MKNINRILALGLICFSCGENFLDEQPISDPISVDFFADADNVRAVLEGAYQPMRWDFNGIYGDSYCMTYLYTDVRSDDVVIENEDFQPHSHEFEDFSLSASHIDVHAVWLKFYTGVAKANEVIQGLASAKKRTLTVEEEMLIIGEARFLRAFYYFELIKNFGDVPLFGDEPIDYTNPAQLDPEKINRRSTTEVYAQIESDLEYAIESLPLDQDELYKATKGASMGLLAKVYLYQEKWQMSADMAQAIIDLNKYSLEEHYGDNWKITNEYGKESLFEISYFNDHTYGPPWSTTARTSLTLQYFGPGFPSHFGWSYNLITQELLQAFNNAGDIERRDATIMQEGHELNSPILSSDSFNPVPPGNRYGTNLHYSLKYFLTPEEVEEHCYAFRYSSLNQKVLRYAEILLILAEAVANGASGDGQGALDQVRARAGLAPVPLTMDGLKLERRLELATEWNRFHDLVRWGDASEELEGFTVGRDELLPIPVDEIMLVGTLPNGEFILTQNPGY